MTKMKPIYLAFEPLCCEVYYICDVCNKVFGDHDLIFQEPNINGSRCYCPHCKSEFSLGGGIYDSKRYKKRSSENTTF